MTRDGTAEFSTVTVACGLASVGVSWSGLLRAMSRRRFLYVSAALVAVLVVVGGVWWLRGTGEGQGMSIPSSAPRDTSPALPAPTVSTVPRDGPPFVTSVSDDGRYFVDQSGSPLLVRGDAPWSLFVDLSAEEVRQYLETRSAQGYNAMIVSLLGAVANGGPSDDGATYDGILPFVGGDVLDWNPEYWQRVHDDLTTAASAGVTAFLYPIDGWTIGKTFSPDSVETCREFGVRVADYFADLPNIVWVMGGDYFPATDDLAAGSDVDHCMAGAAAGIRSTGDRRPFSIQLGYDKSVSTENPYWAPRVDWNFVYTYYPTYAAVLEAYRAAPVPALFSEGNYEGENNQPESAPTTDATLRRQALWAMTSGSPGDVYGSQDWGFEDGWRDRMDSTAVQQLRVIRDFVQTLQWWRLEPDDVRPLVTEGRGTPVDPDEAMDVLDNDYVTAAVTSDDRLALVYVPTARTIGLDRSRLPADASAEWFDPSSGRTTSARLATSMTTPGANEAGDEDWLLVIRAPGSG